MAENSKAQETKPPQSTKLIWAALFGLAFGFLLQKGGVGKFEILIGQLLFRDWTVIQVMLSAIVVGMLGIWVLKGMGRVDLHIKPTRLVSVILGGLVFGVGFGLLGYCPGTAAAALGQGNWDALFGIAGLIAGSYLYAELSGMISKTVNRWGDEGKILLPDMLKIPRLPFIVLFSTVLAVTVLLLELRR